MADEAALEEAPPQEQKQRGLLIPLLGVGVVSVLLSVGGTLGGLALMGVFDEKPPDDVVVEGGGDELPGTGVDGAVATEVVPLKKFTANLKDGTGGRKISLDISLEGRSTDGKSLLADAVVEKEAAIRDTINFLLMDFTSAELSGIDGMLRLRDEIHRRVEVQLEDMGVRVDRVYFTDVVLQ